MTTILANWYQAKRNAKPIMTQQTRRNEPPVNYFDAMHGLGDNIYQRPFLRHFPGAYISTPWPELYQDMDVRCVRSKTSLRTQAKHERTTPYSFHSLPMDTVRKRIFYGPKELAQGGIIDAFKTQFGVTAPLVFDLPHFNNMHPLIPQGVKVAVLRPATLRTEWASASRNPDPSYLCIASMLLREAGFFVVSVADLEPGKEWIVGTAPEADLQLHHGELGLTQLCTLYEQAAAIVAPVGFSIPMAIAYHTPLFVIAGGRGAHNAPGIVTSPDMDLSQTRWAIPDNYCYCSQADHHCDKHISHFDEKFTRWLYEIVLP